MGIVLNEQKKETPRNSLSALTSIQGCLIPHWNLGKTTVVENEILVRLTAFGLFGTGDAALSFRDSVEARLAIGVEMSARTVCIRRLLAGYLSTS